MTLEHGFEMYWSVLLMTCFFFFLSNNIASVFSLERSLNYCSVEKSWLEITKHEIKRTRVWALILSITVQLPVFGRVIYQFLCFWGRDNSKPTFDCAGGWQPNPCGCSRVNCQLIKLDHKHLIKGPCFKSASTATTTNTTGNANLSNPHWSFSCKITSKILSSLHEESAI